MKKIICIILATVCVLSFTACTQENGPTEAQTEETAEAETQTQGANPSEAEWLTDDMTDTLKSISRVDEKGTLYEMNYTADYYSPVITAVVEKAAASLSSGCSAFSTYNTKGDFLLCRNYDYRHKDAEGNYTGLNVVLRTAPEGKYKSLSVCDAYWLSPSSFYAGSLDDDTTDISAMMLAPFMCVDGMNEKGLTASLLVVDVKEGESLLNQDTGKERVMPSQLLRIIIDNAANIEEAIEIAESYDVYSTAGTDLHIYLSDASGVSAVFEWRQYGDDTEQKLYVTYTNAVTNFYVGFDDAQDAYNDDGSLKELFSGFSSTFNNYKYGYGHGYHRFNTIVASLERYINEEDNGHGIRNSTMEEDQALDILRVASQNPGTEKTSFTQYSAIYNLQDLSVSFYMQRDYSAGYTFSLNQTA